MDINGDIVTGTWKQVKGRIRQRRGELSSSELDRVVGRLQAQAGLLQKRRGVLIARMQRAMNQLVKRSRS